LVPNLGVVRRPTGDGTVFADIPGLIAGAHAGVGLGHDFLRHIERTRGLVHLGDVTAPDPVADYHTIQAELKAYGRGLCDRPQLLALNKIDAMDAEMSDFIRAEFAKVTTVPIFNISAVSQAGLDPLLHTLWGILDQAAAEAAAARLAAEREQERLNASAIAPAEPQR
jgi:GTP-binding protein